MNGADFVAHSRQNDPQNENLVLTDLATLDPKQRAQSTPIPFIAHHVDHWIQTVTLRRYDYW